MSIKLTKIHVKPMKICHVPCLFQEEKKEKKKKKKNHHFVQNRSGWAIPKGASPPNKFLKVGLLKVAEPSLRTIEVIPPPQTAYRGWLNHSQSPWDWFGHPITHYGVGSDHPFHIFFYFFFSN
jgi:hypothetical protein